MPFFYDRSNIKLGNSVSHSGHEVYTKASYKPAVGDKLPIIYKKNKNSNPLLSIFEVAFGELAALFLERNLTPSQMLVKSSENKIEGLVIEHVSCTIARNEILPNVFYKFDESNNRFTPVKAKDTHEIPYFFLNQFKHGFFKKLLAHAKSGDITINMESLVSVLATSYTLEEDDLHKANLGIYIVEKDNKPQIVFFKIDHDLMLVDSVMSRFQSRFYHWFFHGIDAFNITKRDLINFPFLRDSSNYYWPTVNRLISIEESKSYKLNEEREAFASLAGSEEFIKNKWKTFYKHILIPPEVVGEALSKHLDSNDPVERSHIALIMQAVAIRQSKLRAVLFSIPKFRDFVKSLSVDDSKMLGENIVNGIERSEALKIAEQVRTTIVHQQELCTPGGGFVAGDTPLHAAIRLQDYRYQDSLQSFGQYIEQKNESGQTPLDIAIQMTKAPRLNPDDLRADAFCTMKHLLREGSRKTDFFKATFRDSIINLNDHLLNSSYINRVNTINNAADFKRLLGEIGEDYRYCLKMQKDLSILAVIRFININKDNVNLRQELLTLKADLNGDHQGKKSPELQYIRQLRNQLWIFRFIRGFLGPTASQARINSLIDKELKRLEPSQPSCWSFFKSKDLKQDGSLGHEVDKLIESKSGSKKL